MLFFSFFEKMFKVIHFFHILPSRLKVFLSETQSSFLNAKYSNAAFIIIIIIVFISSQDKKYISYVTIFE